MVVVNEEEGEEGGRGEIRLGHRRKQGYYILRYADIESVQNPRHSVESRHERSVRQVEKVKKNWRRSFPPRRHENYTSTLFSCSFPWMPNFHIDCHANCIKNIAKTHGDYLQDSHFLLNGTQDELVRYLHL